MKNRAFLIFCLVVAMLLAPALLHAQRRIKGSRKDDVLVKEALSGEALIAQRYDLAGTGATGPNGETLRADDPADPIKPFWHAYWVGPFRDRPTQMWGRGGADQFVIRTYISGKPAVVFRHVDDNGVIDWAGVAGENDFVHDHWVEFFGIVVIKDFDPDEGDTIEVQGHTVALRSLEVVDGDTLVVVQSQQGNGGGAHDEDVLGYIQIEGVELTAADLTFTHTTEGVTETVFEFMDLTWYNQWISWWVERRGYRRPFGY